MRAGKLIGYGNTATVYEWDEGRVVKLFNHGYPKESINKEYLNALAIREMNFSKPTAYELIEYEDHSGIIYDRVEGKSLLDRLMVTGDIQECAAIMAKLHKAIVNNHTTEVPNYKDFLKSHIPNTLLSLEQQKVLTHRIDNLPNGTALCHGDFHPGNLLLSEGGPCVIDFMNICYGNYLYDVARSVFLIEFTPVPVEAEDQDRILHMKKSLSSSYLQHMQVTREMIYEFLEVIRAVRKGECPDEIVTKER
ncbi:MAG: aminoglycoside phosphotransferase [Herbinix sp.]|jgi:uncharacterized protein (TIGR02172 family)|nr:aminoglycoside phosphotransferase [Herbinix sp.]